jgi:3-oxoacyl-[acyl-carrier protein] reductase
MINFSNKKILVTGGSRGIGKNIASLLTELGGSVLITGTKENVEFENDNIEYRKVNFFYDNELGAFLDEISNINFDVLINNAGVNMKGSYDVISDEHFHNVMAVNLIAPFKITQAVISKMCDKNYGRIVNISSLWSLFGAPNRSPYCISKHAINGLTRSIASEYSKYNILINSLSPGFVKTDMTDKNLSTDQKQKIINSIPAGRMADVSEISKVVSFLCSDYNSYITGQNIIVDGGMSACCTVMENKNEII